MFNACHPLGQCCVILKGCSHCFTVCHLHRCIDSFLICFGNFSDTLCFKITAKSVKEVFANISVIAHFQEPICCVSQCFHQTCIFCVHKLIKFMQCAWSNVFHHSCANTFFKHYNITFVGFDAFVVFVCCFKSILDVVPDVFCKFLGFFANSYSLCWCVIVVKVFVCFLNTCTYNTACSCYWS